MPRVAPQPFIDERDGAMGIMASAFFQRDDSWYFVPNEIIGFQLVGGEQRELSSRMALQLTANLLLCAVTLALGYQGWGQWLSPGTTATIAWLPQTEMLYLFIGVAWLLCWSNSLVLWSTVKRLIAKRETRIDQTCNKSGLLRCTRPMQTALMGLFVVGFLTQGFGGGCPVNDGAPICAIIDMVLGIQY